MEKSSNKRGQNGDDSISSKRFKVHAQRKFAQTAILLQTPKEAIVPEVEIPKPPPHYAPLLVQHHPMSPRDDFLTFICYKNFEPAKKNMTHNHHSQHFKKAISPETKLPASSPTAVNHQPLPTTSTDGFIPYGVRKQASLVQTKTYYSNHHTRSYLRTLQNKQKAEREKRLCSLAFKKCGDADNVKKKQRNISLKVSSRRKLAMKRLLVTRGKATLPVKVPKLQLENISLSTLEQPKTSHMLRRKTTRLSSLRTSERGNNLTKINTQAVVKLTRQKVIEVKAKETVKIVTPCRASRWRGPKLVEPSRTENISRNTQRHKSDVIDFSSGDDEPLLNKKSVEESPNTTNNHVTKGKTSKETTKNNVNSVALPKVKTMVAKTRLKSNDKVLTKKVLPSRVHRLTRQSFLTNNQKQKNPSIFNPKNNKMKLAPKPVRATQPPSISVLESTRAKRNSVTKSTPITPISPPKLKDKSFSDSDEEPLAAKISEPVIKTNETKDTKSSIHIELKETVEPSTQKKPSNQIDPCVDVTITEQVPPTPPDVVSQPPKPNAVSQLSKPNVSQPLKPNIPSQPPKPNIASQSPKPNIATQLPKPNIASQSPKLNNATQLPKPSIASQSPKTNTASQSPKPNIANQSPKPNIANQSPKPNIANQSPKPNISSQSPKLNIASQPPKPNVVSPPPKTSKVPAATVSTPKPSTPTVQTDKTKNEIKNVTASIMEKDKEKPSSSTIPSLEFEIESTPDKQNKIKQKQLGSQTSRPEVVREKHIKTNQDIEDWIRSCENSRLLPESGGATLRRQPIRRGAMSHTFIPVEPSPPNTPTTETTASVGKTKGKKLVASPVKPVADEESRNIYEFESDSENYGPFYSKGSKVAQNVPISSPKSIAEKSSCYSPKDKDPSIHNIHKLVNDKEISIPSQEPIINNVPPVEIGQKTSLSEPTKPTMNPLRVGIGEKEEHLFYMPLLNAKTGVDYDKHLIEAVAVELDSQKVIMRARLVPKALIKASGKEVGDHNSAMVNSVLKKPCDNKTTESATTKINNRLESAHESKATDNLNSKLYSEPYLNDNTIRKSNNMITKVHDTRLTDRRSGNMINNIYENKLSHDFVKKQATQNMHFVNKSVDIATNKTNHLLASNDHEAAVKTNNIVNSLQENKPTENLAWKLNNVTAVALENKLSDNTVKKPVTSRPKLRQYQGPSAKVTEASTSKGSGSASKRSNSIAGNIKNTNNTAFPQIDDPAQMVDAPVFHPTDKEFTDPLEFIEKISPVAARYGLCRIVPPPNFKSECNISGEMRFTPHHQYVNRMLYRWGPSSHELCAIKEYLMSQSVDFKQHPMLCGMEVDLPKLYHVVQKIGGLKDVIEKKLWMKVAELMGLPLNFHSIDARLYDIYCKYLLPYDTITKEEREVLFDFVAAHWTLRQEKSKVRPEDPNSFWPSQNEELDYDVTEDIEECINRGKSTTLNIFCKTAQNISSMYFGHLEREPSTDEVEAKFWHHVTTKSSHVCVSTGSIDSSVWGYGFPSTKTKNCPISKHPWNLKVLTNNNGSVLRSLGPVMGVTVPTLHVGMLWSTCCWYRDPHGLPWIEYMHNGSPKIWYGVPDGQSEKFRNALNSIVPNHCRSTPIWLHSDTTMVPPTMLTERGVSLCRTVQQPGEYILVFPKAFTSSICTGYSVSESVYFALSSWLDSAEQEFCHILSSCEPSMFSLQQLIIAISEDVRTPLQVLKQIQPILKQIVQKELLQRSALQNLGVKMMHRNELPVSAKGKIKRSNEPDECAKCRSTIFLSMVSVKDGSLFCLVHGMLFLMANKTQSSQSKVVYNHSSAELHALDDKLLERIKTYGTKRPNTKTNKKMPQSASLQ